MSEQMEKEEEARKQQERFLEIRRYRNMGFPDSEMQHFTFDVDDNERPEITAAMKAYVNNFSTLRKDAKGLLLYGNVGTGKTFHAACVVNALIDRGYPCLMTNFSRLANEISGMWEGKQEYLDGLGRFALVAIDDLGVERDTEYMNEHATTIIDCLYRSKVPVIVTSNYTPKQLTEDCEIRKRRVYDRLLERCHPIKVDGASRRKEKGRSNYNAMKTLLGI
jgi:DNA replication protein DnaC